MCAKWRDECDPDYLVSRIEVLVSTDEQGRVRFEFPEYQFRYAPILSSAFKFIPDVPEVHREQIIVDGIKRAVADGKLTREFLELAITEAEKEFLARKWNDYVLASSISFRAMPPFRKLTVNGHEIRFSRQLPRRFVREGAVQRVKH